MDGKIFISYCWKEPSGSIVNNWLVPAIKAAGINCLVDREACGYNANIDKFEADISKATKVVLVLSPAFFTSLDCMYEAALTVSKCDVEKQVYVINIVDYNFRKDADKWLERADSFFKSLKKECEEAMTNLSDSGKGFYRDKLRKINSIINHLGNLWRVLGSKNSGAFDDISNNGFELVCKELNMSVEESMRKTEGLSNTKITP